MNTRTKASLSLVATALLLFGAVLNGNTMTAFAISQAEPQAPVIGEEEVTAPSGPAAPAPSTAVEQQCDPAYDANTCVPVSSTDTVNCNDLQARNFKVISAKDDPQNLDADNDGIACEETVQAVPVEEQQGTVSIANETVAEDLNVPLLLSEIRVHIVLAVKAVQENDIATFNSEIDSAIAVIDDFTTATNNATAVAEEEPVQPSVEPLPQPTAPVEEEPSKESASSVK